MEREQIIKALECWASGNACEGSRCELFDISPDTCDRWIGRNALSLIKELTEEIEELLEKNSNLHAACWELRADTVRKMQEEINKTLEALCKGDVSEIRRMIDQIAKEMLGVADDND